MRLLSVLIGAAVALPGLALAQPESRPESVVISATPLSDATVDPAKLPAASQTFAPEDIARYGAPDAIGALAKEAAGVSLSDAQANPFQPSLFYRGFEASPLAGDAQGLAVYADGVRLNQPFGDTVNWDLIPDVALDRVTLEGSNPVFGLNAIGGALSMQFKTGFTYQGAEALAQGGSFGRARGAFQYGVRDGQTAFYAAANALSDDGWRQHSPSRLGQVFADFGHLGANGEIHLELAGAASKLTGNGAAPVELLAAARSHVFTFPDETKNTFGLANLHGRLALSHALSLQGNFYVDRMHQTTRNGDASDAELCSTQPGFLCLDNGDVITDRGGNPIPDFLSGGTYGQLNRTATTTTGFGGTSQASYDTSISEHANRLIAGIGFDGGHTRFSAQSQLGALGPDRGFVGPGIVIAQADGSIAPVMLASDNFYYGIFAADVLDVTDALTFSVSARYNLARITLDDRGGTALSGRHSYARLNPAAGLTYRFAEELSAYAGYAEANRAPTPAEFSCADPIAPCSLTNFFVGDPPLKQVVARTIEAGLRGRANPNGGVALTWHAGLFRTGANNDIQFVASDIIGRGFFRNVGGTRRQGVEASLDAEAESWSASLDYSYTDATYRSALVLNSPENPFADGNGEIAVVPGDHLPGVPAHLVKATVSYRPLDALTVTLGARASSGVYLRGDEANLNPKTAAYAVFDLATEYRLGESITLFGSIENLFDAKYATFGTFAPTASVPMTEAPGASNPRALSPAPPFAVFGGVRWRL